MSGRRGDEQVRSAYGRQVQGYFEHVERFLGGGEDAPQRAILAVSALVGHACAVASPGSD